MTKTKDPLGDEHFRTLDESRINIMFQQIIAWTVNIPPDILFGVHK